MVTRLEALYAALNKLRIDREKLRENAPYERTSLELNRIEIGTTLREINLALTGRGATTSCNSDGVYS